jgi:DNA polymerase-3 subunit chi
MWRDEAFIPHGTEQDGNGELQPIWLTDGDDNPNGAAVRFLVDGAAAASLDGLERAVYLFDGRDPAALATARARWSESLKAGHEVTYWQQDEDGRWIKRA